MEHKASQGTGREMVPVFFSGEGPFPGCVNTAMLGLVAEGILNQSWHLPLGQSNLGVLSCGEEAHPLGSSGWRAITY